MDGGEFGGVTAGLINPNPEAWLEYAAITTLSHTIPTLERQSDQNGRLIKHYKKIATRNYLRKYGYQKLVKDIKAEQRKLKANPSDESAKKRLEELTSRKTKLEEDAKKASESDQRVVLLRGRNQEINALEQRVFFGLDGMNGHQASYGRAIVAQANRSAEDESSKTAFVNTDTGFATNSTIAH